MWRLITIRRCNTYAGCPLEYPWEVPFVQAVETLEETAQYELSYLMKVAKNWVLAGANVLRFCLLILLVDVKTPSFKMP